MKSINARIIVSASIVLLVFIIATGLALDRAFRDSARSARQERLLGQIYLLIAAAEVNADGLIAMPPSFSEARFSLPGSGLYGTITDAVGGIAWRSPSALGVETPLPKPIPAGQQHFNQHEDLSGRPFFVYSLGISWAAGARHFPFTFTVTEDLTAFNAQLDLYRRSLWSWLGGMAALLLCAQMIVLRWGLRPLRRVTGEISAIEAGRQERLQGDYPYEIARLTDNLNALLKREHAQQKRYRDALADLAHSLKTPLAVVRGALSSKRDLGTLANAVDEEVTRMNQIVEYQLQRAATAGRSAGLGIRTPLRPVAEKILASLRKVYRDKQISVECEIAEVVFFRGDEGDLTELLGNLTDNAFKWCAGKVAIHAEIRDGKLSITVEDDGPGIDAAQAQRILERGVRTDQTVPGHGIGLAIVRDIIQSYEGEIAIAPSSLGGAAIRITTPSR
ncbi:MAG TPA: ATP-binding protein [Burkholderiales bacterium]|nr:ATP-binding protein [Burkholderiales bacterium]